MNFNPNTVLMFLPYMTFVVSLLIIFYMGHNTKESRFDVFDYFVDPATGKTSTTRTLQIIAGVTSTWVVVKMAIGNNLTVEIFTVYLAAMGISEAFSKFIGAKYNVKPTKEDTK